MKQKSLSNFSMYKREKNYRTNKNTENVNNNTATNKNIMLENNSFSLSNNPQALFKHNSMKPLTRFGKASNIYKCFDHLGKRLQNWVMVNNK